MGQGGMRRDGYGVERGVRVWDKVKAVLLRG
jgi:hypothetical protein